METNKNAGLTETIRNQVKCGDMSSTHKGMRTGKGKAPNPTAPVTIKLPANIVSKQC